MDYNMKFNYNLNAIEARTMRKMEVTCRNNQRRADARGVINYPTWGERRQDIYAQRMAVRLEQRYLHLARAIVKGQPYAEVEQSTREGNEVRTDYLMAILSDYGYNPDVSYVANWLAG